MFVRFSWIRFCKENTIDMMYIVSLSAREGMIWKDTGKLFPFPSPPPANTVLQVTSEERLRMFSWKLLWYGKLSLHWFWSLEVFEIL